MELDREKKRRLAVAANELASHLAVPELCAYSQPDTIAQWLQGCDPNGCHTAELARAEDFEPYDDSSSWEALATFIQDAA
jgi:hypothetical protein